MKPKLLEATLGDGRLPNPKSSVNGRRFLRRWSLCHQCLRCSSP